MKGHGRKLRGQAAIFLLAAGLLVTWLSVATFAATGWQSRTDSFGGIGTFTVWSYNDVDKFRYNQDNGQWWHSGLYGIQWQVLSAIGLSSTFVGDGKWYDLANGFTFQYTTTYDIGYFKDEGAYRFRYRYGTGQWENSANTLSWQALGVAGLSAAFLGSGAWYNLGNGFTYQYTATYDIGYFKDQGAYRFRYRYGTGQWENSANALSWQVLGSGGLSAAFVGGGTWYDLGNGFTYQYTTAYDIGYFKDDGTYRFRHRYGTGQWESTANALSWQVLGAEGLSAAFVGSGAWCNLGNGFTYQYTTAYDLGYFKDDGNYRFRYRYGTGQWENTANTLSWQALGAAGLSAAFVGSGTWYNLDNGFTYQYTTAYGIGYFKDNGIYRFRYQYGTGQWEHTANTLSWEALGVAGRSALFVGTVTWYNLGNGFTYQYTTAYDTGYFKIGTSYRFRYQYGSGQWSDSVEGRGWQTVGAAGRTGLFIADGVYRNLGDGYQYKYAADLGYFRFDAAHTFRQTYATGSWEYLHDSDQWSPWSAATILQDMVPGTDSTGAGWFRGLGGYLYFAANDGAGWDCYRWDGQRIQEISGNRNFSQTFEAWAQVGGKVLFVCQDALGWDIYAWDGSTFQEISGNQNFSYVARPYGWWTMTGLETFIFADGAGGSHLYRYDGTTLQDISGVHSFSDIWYAGTLGSDVFFTARDANGWDLYRWNGVYFQDVTGSSYFSGLLEIHYSSFYYKPSPVGTELFFSASDGSGWDLYGWNGTVFHNISLNQNFSDVLRCSGTLGSDVFFTALDANGWDLYRWDGTFFYDVSGNQNFTSLLWVYDDYGTWTFSPPTQTEFLFKALDANGWDLYRWDGTFFYDVSGNKNFTNLSLSAILGSDLIFTAADSSWDVYRWNGTIFHDISGNLNLSVAPWVSASDSVLTFVTQEPAGAAIYQWNRTSSVKISGDQLFLEIRGVAKNGSDFFFGCRDASGWDLYRWNGTSFVDVSGNQHFAGLTQIIYNSEPPSSGWTFYQVTDSTGLYDLYGWDGSSFRKISDLNSSAPLTPGWPMPVTFNGEVYFWPNTSAYGMEPWMLWAGHLDFLWNRMP